jgi:hypothetical protein
MSVDPMKPEILVSVPSDVEAAAIVAGLDAHGIRAISAGEYTAGFRAETPGMVDVIVRSEDLASARQVLTQLQQGSADVDWPLIDESEL